MILRERFKCLLKNLKYIKQERGAVFVLTAILLPVLFGCLGIGYDVGNVYMHKARLQNIADAAALAGGRAYLQSQLKTGEFEHKDTYDSYTNGNDTDVEYVVGVNGGGISTTREGNHPDADIAADKYIRNNIINLGKNVYSDKYSHYALRGLKKVGEDYVYDSKIFYRIGLYEDVPLRFLPLITNKFSGRVRAGAVALVVPGTPGTESGNPASKDNSGVTSPSIFDNLFTFSEWLFTRNLTLNDGTVEASFEGTMVYTHLNNTADDPSSLYTTLQPSRYFHYEADNGSASDEFQYTHMYENAIGSNVSTSKGVINDPYINTFYDTKAYLDAFKAKLYEPHFDVRDGNDFTGQNALRITGDHLASSGCKYIVASGDAQGTYYRLDGDYCLFNSDNEQVTFQDNGKTYKVCYRRFLYSNYFFRCGKTEGDDAYYILTSDNKITNCYIKLVQPDPSNIYWRELRACINNDQTNISFDNGNFKYSNGQIIPEDAFTPGKPAILVDGSVFQQQSVNGGNTNIYHVMLPRLNNEGDTIKNLEIQIDNPITGDDINKPVYVLIDGINQVTIKGSANMTTGRPLILVFLSEGTTQLKYEYTGDFFGTIYAPVSTFEHAKGSGSFTGNIIAKTINIQASTQIAWKQENHLEKFKYEYVKDPTGDYVLENGNYRKLTEGETVTGERYKKVQVFKYIADSNGDYLFVNGAYRKAEEGEQGTHKRVPVYAYLDQAIKTVSDETAAKIEKENQDLEKALQEQNTTLEEFTEDIYTKLGLSKDEIVAAKADSNWYNNQTFGRKKTLYTKWRALYDSYPANSPLRNLLWPWNEHFGIDPEEEEIEATPETLRLINYRTEFQLKETMNNDDVVDPFIFETLRQPNSY